MSRNNEAPTILFGIILIFMTTIHKKTRKMDITNFKRLIKKSYRGWMFAGLFIGPVGVLMGIGGVVRMEEDGPGLLIFGVVFTLIGLLLLVLGLKRISAVNNGEHPLIKAIEQKDQEFVTWLYMNITTVNGVKSHGVMIVKQDGKPITINARKENVASGIIEYLSIQFPSALIGYDDETRKAASERLGRKV